MLSAGDLASMRAEAENSLPGTAIIQTKTVTSDGGGGGTASWTAAGTVACRLSPGSDGRGGGERVDGERITPDAQFVITLPWDASVTEANRLSIDSTIYSVTEVADRDWQITKPVGARRVD